MYRTERLLKDKADCAFSTSRDTFTLEHPPDTEGLVALRAACSIERGMDQA